MVTENQEKLKEIHYVYSDNNDFVNGQAQFLIDEEEILVNILKINQDFQIGYIDIFSVFWILCFSGFPASILFVYVIQKWVNQISSDEPISQIFPDIIIIFVSLIGIGMGIRLIHNLFLNIKLTHFMSQDNILKMIYKNGELKTGKVSSIHKENDLVEIRFRIVTPNSKPYTYRYFTSRPISLAENDNILLFVWQNYMIPL